MIKINAIYNKDREALIRIAHALFAYFYVSEAIEDDNPPPAGSIEEKIIAPLADPTEILLLLFHLIGAVEAKWGFPIQLVFYHMGLCDSQREDALFALMMSVFHSGISLSDDYDAAFERAKSVLRVDLDIAPVEMPDTEWREFAQDVYNERKDDGCVYVL